MKAGMQFLDEPLKDVFVDIDEIYFNRNDEDHIKPKNSNDFDCRHLYGVHFCYCKNNECLDSNLCKYYKGYIFGLGETEQEIRKNHEESGKRIGFKNQKLIEETTDTSEEESQKAKKACKREAKQIIKTVWNINTARTLEKHKRLKFINCRKKLIKDYADKCDNRTEGAKDATGCNEPQNLSHNNNNDQHSEDNYNGNHLSSDDRNKQNGLDNNNELADLLPEGSDDSSDDEPRNVEDLNKDNWSYIKVYKYKLFKYLKKLRPDNNNYTTLENEPEMYSESNNMKYLGMGINIGCLSWRIVENKKDDMFLREVAPLIWSKKKLANRCLKISRVQNNIPERSPVKVLTPQKLNHFLRLYRDYLTEKKYPEDKIRWCIRKSTATLPFLIRDLRDKAIKKANRNVTTNSPGRSSDA